MTMIIAVLGGIASAFVAVNILSFSIAFGSRMAKRGIDPFRLIDDFWREFCEKLMP